VVSCSIKVPKTSCNSFAMAIAMGIGRDKWDVGDSGVDDGWLWIPNVMVLHLESRFGDRLSVGKSMW
jgi:hypothetical protein